MHDTLVSRKRSFAAGVYKVALGIINEQDATKNFYCPTRLADNTGLAPGEIGTWSRAFCCSFGVGTVPTGHYFAAVYTDFDHEVAESSEDNNSIKSPTAFIFVP